MTHSRWKAWHAQEPPSGFTERTVAALLRDRGRRRTFGGRRWALAVAMAAVLVGGAAWGLGGFSLPSRSLPAPPAPATIEPRPEPPARVVHEPPAEITPPAVPAPSVPRRRVEAPPPATSASAGRKVVLPRCYCSPNEAICDCF
jgi:hypothetical protein